MKKFFLFILLCFFSFILIATVHATECGSTDKCDVIKCDTKCPKSDFNDAGGIRLCICRVMPTSSAGTISNPVLDPTVGSGNMGETIIAKLLAAIIRLFFIAGSVAVLVFFLIGGLAWITSEGDKGKMEIAKNRLTFAGIGIVIMAAAYAILQILGIFLGINFFKGLIIVWPTITGP